ncbi:hypothetical protein SDC9_158399 [bioreactor metagenome]|uniref:Uncharacterized protein n=1 Tax=bioreactor metagenome TaxID=1076179 RepID=A0A645F9P5_9ZZZZ
MRLKARFFAKLPSGVNDVMSQRVIYLNQIISLRHPFPHHIKLLFGNIEIVKGILHSQAMQVDQVRTISDVPVDMPARYGNLCQSALFPAFIDQTLEDGQATSALPYVVLGRKNLGILFLCHCCIF